MKVRFRQSGGFAGVTRGAEVDADALDAEERRELERLVEAATAVKPGRLRARHSAYDLAQYVIDIESASGKRRLKLDDLNVSDAIEPLIAFLQKHAKPISSL